MIIGTGFMATLVYGGMLVQRGELAVGAYNVVSTAQLRMLAAIGHFGASLQGYQRTSVSLDRVFRILDMEPTISSAEHAVPFSSVTRSIEFDNVSFGYDADRLVLRGFKLTIPAGKTVGVVGSSGAGKSTVLKLMLRFYDVTAGAVRYDGVDVRDLRLDDLHHSIAMVSQELAVFAGSIRDNIAYARPGATDADVRRAAEVAEAHEFIVALSDGYDTVIGHGGLALSAGQRQRLAIARVVLADRPILVFDEATSALDYQTEASVQRSLQQVTAGRTTVIVAHRLSTIRRADLIYVLDDGQVKERGRHDDLIAADGIYAAMWKVQTGEIVKRVPPTQPPADA
jgi:ATP-binding cassette subfamily B protein